MAVALPPGARKVELRYGIGTPWRTTGLAISCLAAAAAAIALRRGLRAPLGAVNPEAGR